MRLNVSKVHLYGGVNLDSLVRVCFYSITCRDVMELVRVLGVSACKKNVRDMEAPVALSRV